MMSAETATQALHRLTSIGSEYYDAFRLKPDREWPVPVEDPRALSDLEILDMDRFPWFFKRYDRSLPRLALPRALPSTTASAVAVMAGTAEVPPTELDLPQLARLLHLSAGVVRTQHRDWLPGGWPFRAAGSAGGRFPLEVYVTVPDGTAVPGGVHWFDPEHHALVRVGPPPRGGGPAVVVTGVPWRTGWKYRERGYRHVYWDAGTMLAQVQAVADSAGLPTELYSRFPDGTVASLVGADGVHEWPVAVVALRDGRPALEAAGPAEIGAVDAAPLEFPLVTAAQRAGERDGLGPPWDRGAPVDVPLPEAAAMESVVLARGSQRRMDPSCGLSKDLLRASLGAALRGIAVRHRVVANNVEGLSPGLYRWPALSAPSRPGDLRKELYRVCMEQALPRDAAFVVISAAGVGALDDREYREAHLAAGVAMGRLHLLAYALGASASGMTFVDGEVSTLLGEPLDGLLFTCVGVLEYRSKPGGPPGQPTVVGKVEPRMLDE